LISWIKGEVIDLWQSNNKFYILINCQDLGYEIQILESVFTKFKSKDIADKNIILWIKHIKKEDSDLLFGFFSKDQKDFFIDVINIKGIGAQIGMAMLNKLSVNEIINAINTQNKKIIGSVPGIGQKMTDRLILELKNKFKNELQIDEDISRDAFVIKNTEIKNILCDLELTLQSLNYKKNEIRNALSIVKEKNITNQIGEDIKFENLLKLAMNYLDKNSRNIVG
tara:strand:- start:209 stop:883 length:675 start_codon:yes stop_codon:yes gene_type:complete